MKQPALPSLDALPPASIRRVEKVCSDFETAWQSGQTPRIETKLAAVEEPEYSVLLLELLRLEIAYRVRQGQQPAAKDYQSRFPQKADLVKHVFQEMARRPVDAGQGTAMPREMRGTKQQGIRETASAGDPASRDTPAYQSASRNDAGDLPRMFGRYRLLRKLGQGGMGTVFLAHDTELDRQIALKMPRFLADDSEMMERFYREARAAATLQHPNLCAVYDVGAVEGRPYYTMAFIEGKPLSDSIRPGKFLPPAKCAAVVRKLALALQQAHDRGVVHRDLKPGNVMLQKGGEPVVVDFGLARRTLTEDSRLTQTGDMVGTPAYMAPEQVKGDREAIGPACDIYAVGVLLFEMLTGRLPFQGPKHHILTQIESVEAPSVASLRSDVDPRLDRICKRALAKNSADRHPSMRELAEEIQAYLRESAWRASSPPAPTASPLRRSKWRWPFLASGFGALAALVAAVMILFWETPKGTIRIEIDDPSIKVAIDKGVFKIYGADKHEIHLAMGEHGLHIQRGDLEFETEKFVLTKGRLTTLKIQFLPGKVQVAEGARVLGEGDVKPQGPPPLSAVAPFGVKEARAHQEAWAKHLGVPVEYAQSSGIKLVLIPPGEFLMGSPDSEEIPADSRNLGDKGGDERPQNRVRITKPLYVSAYEITQGEYQAITERNPSLHQESPRDPVEQVSWEEALEFCNKVTEGDKKLGLVYRLPTEAEWEYACRAGTTTAYHYGDSCTAVQANLGGGFPLRKPTPVGKYKPNPWGLYDMHGNVSEWCLDAPLPRTAQPLPIENPRGAMDLGQTRALRGGSYFNPAGMSRSAARQPGQASSYRHALIGFRVVAELPGQKLIGAIQRLPKRQEKPEDYFQRGKAEYAKFNYKKAIEEYTEAIRLNKDFTEAYFERGLALTQDSQFALGLSDFTETLKLKPDHALARDMRSTTYINLGEYEKAVADAEELVRHAPFDPSSYVARAWANIAWGGVKGTKAELENGISDCNEALKKNSGHGRAIGTRGLAYFYMEQNDKALADYNEAIRLWPSWTWPYLNRSRLYFKQKEYAKAIADCTRLIQLGDRFPIVYELRGCSYFHLQKYEEAIADFSVWIRLNPNAAWAYQYRGMAYDKKGDPVRAKTDRDTATSLNRGIPLAEGNLHSSFAPTP